MVDSNLRRRRSLSRSPLLWSLVGLGAAMAVVGAVWSGSGPYDLVSSAYPGDLSVALMALARLVALLTGSVTAGATAFAAFFVGHHPEEPDYWEARPTSPAGPPHKPRSSGRWRQPRWSS